MLPKHAPECMTRRRAPPAYLRARKAHMAFQHASELKSLSAALCVLAKGVRQCDVTCPVFVQPVPCAFTSVSTCAFSMLEILDVLDLHVVMSLMLYDPCRELTPRPNWSSHDVVDAHASRISQIGHAKKMSQAGLERETCVDWCKQDSIIMRLVSHWIRHVLRP